MKKNGINVDKINLEKALLAHQNGRLEEAEKLYRQLIKIAPNDSNNWYLLGTLYHQTNRITQAKKYLDHSIKLAPDVPQALNSRGILYKENGQVIEAQRDFRRALDLAPAFAEALTNLADTCRLTGDYLESKKLNKQAIKLAPYLAPAHNNYGAVEKDLGNLEKARVSFETAIQLDAKFIDASINLTITLRMLGQTHIALKTAVNTLEKAPYYAPAYNSLGSVYFDLNKDEEAKDAFMLACSNNPNYADAHNNLGNTLTRLNQLAEAELHYNKAIKLDPNNADFWSNKAASFQADNRVKETIEACNNALSINPKHADARWNRGIANLISGDLLEGFADYEARWLLPEFESRARTSQLWVNQNLTKKSILVYSEQGYGDTIQFARYMVPLAQLKPKSIYLETEKSLINLFRNITSVDKFLNKGEKTPKSDYHVPLMSLAHRFKTTLQNIPAPAPSLWTEENSPYLFRKENKSEKKIKVGLVWAGRRTHKNNKNRSMSLDTCLPFLKCSKAQFYSLQIDGASECEKQTNYIKDLSSYITDFASTGSIIKNLDLVITVDTALAHLAGSLGVKCWVMLPFAPDWRWLLNKSDSPWYSSITLFRQQKQNKWDEVVTQVLLSLEKFYAK